ncbi:MAG: hypothetical protein R3178_05115, partial [Rhodothermales bacterium]|nr:hypothetical protein [Rhodothermales bacterium]
MHTRAEFERRLGDARSLLQSEFGAAPRRAGWVIPLLAATVGLSLAFGLRRGMKNLGHSPQR